MDRLGRTWWRPILWSIEMLNDLENIYVIGKHHLIDKLTHWRQRLSDVASYSITPVPLVYTQVSPSLHHTVSHCITLYHMISGGAPRHICLLHHLPHL